MRNSKKGVVSKRSENKSKHFILMGDIIGSSNYEYNELKNLKKSIDAVNKVYDFISPLTITLGDEFQGIVRSLQQGIKAIFKIEELLIKADYPFELRYSLGFGEIITPVNSEIAHGMYGQGLTKTRSILEGSKKNKRRRFDIWLPNEKFNEVLSDSLFVYQSFLDNWNKKDLEVVSKFYESRDYKEVAKLLNKRSDQIWKREKNLRIREYFEIQNVILNLSGFYSMLYDKNEKSRKIISELISNIVFESLNNEYENVLKNNKITKRKIQNTLSSKKIVSEIFDQIGNIVNLIH